MKGKTNALLKMGGGSALVNINLTLDGATNTITNGAKITITNNATGEEIVKTWEGDMIQVQIDGMTEYTIKCSKITGYTSPKKVVFISSNDVTYDYTFNYITPPVGVYLLTTDDELIAPSKWKSSYDCVGVYIGRSDAGDLPYKNYVLAPEIVDIATFTLTSSNFNAIVQKMAEEATSEYGNRYESIGACNYCGYTNSRYAARAGVFLEAWNYDFKNGAQAFVPALFEVKLLAENYAAIYNAYSAIGVTVPYTVNYYDYYNWRVQTIQSTTPVMESVTLGSTTRYLYGWGYRVDDGSWDSVAFNVTTTIPFSAY